MKSPNPDWKNPVKTFEQDATRAQKTLVEEEISDFRELVEKSEEEVKEIYRERKQLFDARREMRTALISTFRTGVLSENTDWDIKGVWSLHEVPGGPADLLIGHGPNKSVFCIIGLVQLPDSEDLFDRCQSLHTWINSNSNSLNSQHGTSLSPGNGSIALAVTMLDTQEAAETIGRGIRSTNNSPQISIWNFENGENQFLSALESADRWTPYLPGDELGDLLSKGVKLSEDLHDDTKMYTDSHHESIFKHLVAKNYSIKKGTDIPVNWFSDEELKLYAKKLSNTYSESNTPDERIDELINWWMRSGLITEEKDNDHYSEDDNAYRFLISGGKLSTKMEDVEIKYIDSQVDIIYESLAKRNILKEDNDKDSNEDVSDNL